MKILFAWQKVATSYPQFFIQNGWFCIVLWGQGNELKPTMVCTYFESIPNQESMNLINNLKPQLILGSSKQQFDCWIMWGILMGGYLWENYFEMFGCRLSAVVKNAWANQQIIIRIISDEGGLCVVSVPNVNFAAGLVQMLRSWHAKIRATTRLTWATYRASMYEIMHIAPFEGVLRQRIPD